VHIAVRESEFQSVERRFEVAEAGEDQRDVVRRHVALLTDVRRRVSEMEMGERVIGVGCDRLLRGGDRAGVVPIEPELAAGVRTAGLR